MLVVSNIQTPGAATFLTASQRLRVPTVGYLASWDHTVGKGVVWPGLARYIVQNDLMRDDLVRYHGIGGDVAVTGWPQSDAFAAPQPLGRFAGLLGGLGVDSALPTVLVTGNTPTNAPYEGRFVERLVAWWEEHGRGRLGLVFRPHPRDRAWRERYAAAVATAGVGTQEPSYTDLEDLATLLQHVAVVVTNAGTILLDAVANDRPVVCVVYDEGAPAGEHWAAKNILGEHYRQLLASNAFPLARGFDDVVTGIEDALHDPRARSEARRRVTHEVLGEVDGHAAQRVADAIVSQVG